MFFPSNFVVLGLTFRFLIYFEFIFVCGMKKYYGFIHSCPIFQAPLIGKTVFFSVVYSCLLCHELIDYSVQVYFWALYSVLLICLFLCQYYAILIIVALQYSLKSGRVIPLVVLFFSQDCFGNFEYFMVLHEFQDYLFQLGDKYYEYFIRVRVLIFRD